MSESDTVVVEEEPPPREEKAATSPPPPSSWQSRVRKTVTPFLPPPVVAGLQRLDPALEPYLGPDAVVTATFTIVVAAWIVWILSRVARRSGRAVQHDDDAAVLHTRRGGAENRSTLANDFEETVLLCGPRNSGKTRLFYQLCYAENKENIPTLMSIKANIGIQHPIRYFDWPGHSKLAPDLVPILQQQQQNSRNKKVRVVLVLDATQPVRAAADTLNELLEIVSSSSKKNNNNRLTVFVACHKSDLPKAKNARRIKIQLRTELEKILEITSVSTSWWPSSSEELDLDAIPFCRLYFASTQCQNGIISPELLSFCHTGELPASAS